MLVYITYIICPMSCIVEDISIMSSPGLAGYVFDKSENVMMLSLDYIFYIIY